VLPRLEEGADTLFANRAIAITLFVPRWHSLLSLSLTLTTIIDHAVRLRGRKKIAFG
jgi:hypothetical protein